MRQSMLIVIVFCLFAFTLNGCFGHGGYNARGDEMCRPAPAWQGGGNAVECVTPEGDFHEYRTYEWEVKPWGEYEARRDLERQIEYHRQRQQYRIEIRAHHARRAMQACRERRWHDLGPRDAARCRTLRAAGKIK